MSLNVSKGTPQQLTEAIQNRISELSIDAVEGSSDVNNLDVINAADDSDDMEYIEELAKSAAALASEDSGYDVTHTVAGSMITFVAYKESEQLGTYIQPIDDIFPDWSEIDDDAQQLASDMLEEFMSPDVDDSVVDSEVEEPTI